MNEMIKYVFKNTHRKDTRVVVHKLKHFVQFLDHIEGFQNIYVLRYALQLLQSKDRDFVNHSGPAPT